MCQIHRFDARDDVEWEQGDYLEEEEGSSDSEEEGEVINDTEVPEEYLPSAAATETVCEEQQPGQPREPKELGPEDRLARHVAQRLRTALTTA